MKNRGCRLRLEQRFRFSQPLNLNLLFLFPLGDCIGRRMAAAVGDAEVYLSDARLFEHIAGPSMQSDDRLATPLIANLDFSPANSTPPTGAQRFEDRFLGHPSTGVMLRCRLSAAAILDLQLGINAADEKLPMPLDHLRNSKALDDVRAYAKNVHEIGS